MTALKYRITAFLLIALLALGSSGTALADSTTGTLTVTAGTLTESNATTPAPSATLNGTDQTVNYTLTITVTDATGSGNGWNLTITSTTFTTGGGSPHTLSATASSITGVTAACAASTTCVNPTNAITYPVTVPAASSAPAAVKCFNASANTGMGKFTITPTVAISLPADTYAGTYTSTITLAIVSGP
jgi:hypothetical protein